MANERDIKIGIKTTADTSGAKEAESAIRKVDAAADAAGGQLGSAKAGSLAGGAERATDQLKKTADAADKASGMSRAMRANVQNLGYQVADVAVQLEMGTSAVRTFSQQGSQMLGVLGPWGAVAGAALAIGGALFSASQSSEKAKEDITGDAEEIGEGMKALKEFVDDAAEALKMDELGASNEAFEARIQAVDRLNKKLDRQLEIAKQLRDIELQKQDAESAAQIAEVEASDMPEEEKARKVAKIRAEMDERSRQQQLNSIRLEETKAKLEVEAAKAKEAAAKVNFDANRQNFERNQRETDEAQAAFGKAPAERERLQAELDELAIRNAKGRLAYGSEGGGAEGQRFREEIEAEEFRLKSDIALQSPEELAKVLTEAAKYRDAAKEEFEAARDALREAQKGLEDASSKEAGVSQIASAQRDLINVQGGSAARISESQRAAEERKREAAERKEAAKAEIERQQQRIEGAEENLDQTAGRNRDRVRGGGRSDLRQIAEQIGRADTEDEIRVIGDKIRESQASLGAATVQALQQMLQQQLTLIQQIEGLKKGLENLKSRIDKMR
jgi:hypothetical protein